MTPNPSPQPTAESAQPLIQSELDEQLMRENLMKTYGTKVTGFRVSCEHYRYIAEQVVSLRRITTLQRAYLATRPFPAPPAESERPSMSTEKADFDA